ncbi:MAG: 30S ribosomal protein S9 [Candidatus Kerfeldbacteria bacterium]
MYAVGRRKQSVARVRYYIKGDGEIIINTKDYKTYFPYFEYQKIIEGPLKLVDKLGKGKVTVKVVGGGIKGQADSIKLGISRIILKIDEANRPLLRANKLLTRDPRVKERKKYGLKKARRAPQWAKR